MNKPYICPKCNIEKMGSANQILDFVVCNECSDVYEIELVPTIKKMINAYFFPGRDEKKKDIEINGEDLEVRCLRAELERANWHKEQYLAKLQFIGNKYNELMEKYEKLVGEKDLTK